MIKTIKDLPPILSNTLGQLTENQKISYWLEKLFKQEKDKEAKTLKEGVSSQVSQQTVANTQTQQSLEEKGQSDAIKSHANKVERDRQTVQDMVNNSNRILLKVSTVFPWDFFPTDIIVEETRVTIVYHQLFSSQVHSVDIKDISNVFVNTSILFAQLTIVSNTFSENQIIVDRLWKKEAVFAKRIIEGLRMFVSRDIDTTGYKAEELISKLKELSTTI